MATAETDDFVQWFYISVIFYNNALGYEFAILYTT